MEILALWFVMAVITAIVASSRGRSAFGWFLIGCLLSVFGLILVALLPSLKQTSQGTAPVFVGGEVATPETHVRCPACKGLVHKEARKCMHCGTTLVPASEQPARGLDALASSGYVAPPIPSDKSTRALDSKMPAYDLGHRISKWMRGRR